MRVIIDPGHGGIDTGAILFNSDKTKRITTESIQCAELAEQIKITAGQRGISPVRLTRTVDQKEEPTMQARTAGMGSCDVYAAIHMDTAAGRSWLFWSDRPAKRKNSEEFALILKQKLIDAGLSKEFIPTAEYIRPDSRNVRAPDWKQLYISDASTTCAVLWEVCAVRPLAPWERLKLSEAFANALATYQNRKGIK